MTQLMSNLSCLHPGMNDEHRRARVVLLTDDNGYLKRWEQKKINAGGEDEAGFLVITNVRADFPRDVKCVPSISSYLSSSDADRGGKNLAPRTH